MQIKDLKNKKILVLGLGKEGFSTVKFLQENFPDQKISLADQRELTEFTAEEKQFLTDQAKFELILGKQYLEKLADFEVIIKSPGINPRTREIAQAIEKGLLVTSATRIFFANRKGKVIGVTGSKGKSTTASLIYAVLKEGELDVELVGNIGKSALDYLKIDSLEKIFVFEMSSYQLEDFNENADVAVLISFFPEHLDYHGSLEAYFAAKMHLVAGNETNKKQLTGAKRNKIKVVYNKASREIADYLEEKMAKDRVELIAFNDGKSSRVEGAAAWLGEERLVRGEEIKLLGKHNLENILAAAAVGQIFKVSLAKIRLALIKFNGLEHRLEPVGKFKDIEFYNDAISTTPESTMAALEAFKNWQIGTMLVGGMNRGYDFKELAQKILQAKVKNLIIFPETGELIWKEIVEQASLQQLALPRKFETKKMEEAVKYAYEETPKESICLMSNASPSYNLFKNFEEKGQQFKHWVKELGELRK